MVISCVRTSVITNMPLVPCHLHYSYQFKLKEAGWEPSKHQVQISSVVPLNPAQFHVIFCLFCLPLNLVVTQSFSLHLKSIYNQLFAFHSLSKINFIFFSMFKLPPPYFRSISITDPFPHFVLLLVRHTCIIDRI